MSRLIVKGLPKYYDEDKLRAHFSHNGASVTDVKLMKKRNGESRLFAFIGFKSPQDAEAAVRFFNKSFIDTARIEVQLAKTFSDPTVPMSFREKRRLNNESLRALEDKLNEETEMHKAKRSRKNAPSSLDAEIASNPKLQEFMEVMKPSHQVKSWANDSIADGKGAPSTKELDIALADGEVNVTMVPSVDKSAYQVKQAKDSLSDDEYDDFNGFGNAADEDEAEEIIPLSASLLAKDENTTPSADHLSAADTPNTAANENMSDLEWLKSRSVRIKESGERPVSHSNTPSVQGAAQDEPIPQTQEHVVPEISISEVIAATGRLFVRNILYTSTEQDFRDLFSKYGKLSEVHIAIDTRTGKSKGYVYVQYANYGDAVEAYYALDKQIFQGRLLHILPGQKKKDHRLDEFDLKNLPLKKQRELKKKDQASKLQFSWNSLYMNSDAVLESVAAKMGVSKSALIDPQDSSSAVKQALAEAHVIGDARRYFEERGVDLTKFDGKERDDRIILVKNFTYGTTIEELGELFTPYGQLNRLLMPPAGTIAILEFRDAPSARAAFSKLAYRRFKKGILYLEKGPKDLFTREASPQESSSPSQKDETVVSAKASASDIMESNTTNQIDDETDVPEGPTVSVFIKNLNFATTSLALTEAFKELPGFKVATVKTKPDPKKPNSVLSMGFGFVEFATKEEASRAISVMDGHVLDGHKLLLKLSHRQGTASTKSSVGTKSGRSNKIIIKNLPFEATRKDVFELFGAFGQLKSVRVPKKFDKSARGFAFVEFSLLKEAESAMSQLEGVHLLGRRLVMQYAELDAADAEAEIEKMTKKVKKQIDTENMAAMRMMGKGKVNLEEEKDEFGEMG